MGEAAPQMRMVPRWIEPMVPRGTKPGRGCTRDGAEWERPTRDREKKEEQRWIR